MTVKFEHSFQIFTMIAKCLYFKKYFMFNKLWTTPGLSCHTTFGVEVVVIMLAWECDTMLRSQRLETTTAHLFTSSEWSAICVIITLKFKQTPRLVDWPVMFSCYSYYIFDLIFLYFRDFLFNFLFLLLVKVWPWLFVFSCKIAKVIFTTYTFSTEVFSQKVFMHMYCIIRL